MGDFLDISDTEKKMAGILEYYNYNKKSLEHMVMDFKSFYPQDFTEIDCLARFTEILNTPEEVRKLRDYTTKWRENYTTYCDGSIESKIKMLLPLSPEERSRLQSSKSCDADRHAEKGWFFKLHPRFTVPQIRKHHISVMDALAMEDIVKLPSEMQKKMKKAAKIVIESCEFDLTKEAEMVNDLYEWSYKNTDHNDDGQPQFLPSIIACRKFLRDIYEHPGILTALKENADQKEGRRISFVHISDLYDLKKQANKDYKLQISDIAKPLLFVYPFASMQTLESAVHAFNSKFVKKQFDPSEATTSLAENIRNCYYDDRIQTDEFEPGPSGSGAQRHRSPRTDEGRQSSGSDVSPRKTKSPTKKKLRFEIPRRVSTGADKKERRVSWEDQKGETDASKPSGSGAQRPRHGAPITVSADKYFEQRPQTSKWSFGQAKPRNPLDDKKGEERRSRSSVDDPAETDEGRQSSGSDVSPRKTKSPTKRRVRYETKTTTETGEGRRSSGSDVSPRKTELPTTKQKMRIVVQHGASARAVKKESPKKEVFRGRRNLYRPFPAKRGEQNVEQQPQTTSDEEIVTPEPKGQTLGTSEEKIVTPEPKGQTLGTSEEEIVTPESPKNPTKRMASSSDDEIVASQPTKKAKQ